MLKSNLYCKYNVKQQHMLLRLDLDSALQKNIFCSCNYNLYNRNIFHFLPDKLMGFSDWIAGLAPGDPDNHCAVIHYDGWQDHHCNEQHSFACVRGRTILLMNILITFSTTKAIIRYHYKYLCSSYTFCVD